MEAKNKENYKDRIKEFLEKYKTIILVAIFVLVVCLVCRQYLCQTVISSLPCKNADFRNRNIQNLLSVNSDDFAY